MTKVMVVDDSRFMQDEVSHLLADSDYEVVFHCRDAEEAIVAYTKNPPDIVLMDIVLPGIDGFEATRALLGKWPDARIVIISSLAYDDTIKSAKACGAKCFLFKPFTKEQLIDLLNRCMEQDGCFF